MGVMAQENKIKTLLVSLGICDEDSIQDYYPRVRDRDDIAVLKCNKSGVILLSRSDHMSLAHYHDKDSFEYWPEGDRTRAVLSVYEDTNRRVEQIRPLVVNKNWLDVGTGAGAILDALGSAAATVAAVEPQNKARNTLKKLGYSVFPQINAVEGSNFDLVTLFHVFEHFTDPVEELKALRSKMAPGAQIFIEVPHADDFLISFLEHDSFKRFTFWSEHLILHTRRSLTRMLEAAGFSEICVKGFQRYPLANHLHWLARNAPGGHVAWDVLRTPELDLAYGQMLAQMDKTDTLIATARRR